MLRPLFLIFCIVIVTHGQVPEHQQRLLKVRNNIIRAANSAYVDLKKGLIKYTDSAEWAKKNIVDKCGEDIRDLQLELNKTIAVCSKEPNAKINELLQITLDKANKCVDKAVNESQSISQRLRSYLQKIAKELKSIEPKVRTSIEKENYSDVDSFLEDLERKESDVHTKARITKKFLSNRVKTIKECASNHHSIFSDDFQIIEMDWRSCIADKVIKRKRT
ncbi:uncharacterized protein LOC109595306 [Aethina tumida]|uniref:uncharacterized protein LOC109595306 n=1 Tax=Aethina tumida TaxID=116153 RepID=UPI002147F6C9|nr:uncharacterized protein LOC109595306 [Aethina tumida]